MPWLWLVDVHRNPMRFHYRLSGTEHSLKMGGDRKGQFMDEIHRNFAESPTGRQHIAVAESGQIAYREGKPTLRQERHFWIQRLLLPFARDGRVVDLVMGMALYSDMDEP